MSRDRTTLPTGVQVLPLKMRPDPRGCLTELFRLEWHKSPAPVQWNVVTSEPDVLRGVHVHKEHWDYLFVVAGEMLLGLHDMRADSPTHGKSALVHLRGQELRCAVVPPGVAHGFYFPCVSTLVYSVSEYWKTTDELGCRWDAPELGLDWPCRDPKLSERDSSAESYSKLASVLRDTRW